MTDKTFTRRTFLRQVSIALPAGAVMLQTPAEAADLPKLTEDDPTAKALFYVHDASQVDASNPATSRFEAGQNCANCIQIQGPDGDAWRPCGIFPGKLVNNAGWCNVWVVKP